MTTDVTVTPICAGLAGACCSPQGSPSGPGFWEGRARSRSAPRRLRRAGIFSWRRCARPRGICCQDEGDESASGKAVSLDPSCEQPARYEGRLAGRKEEAKAPGERLFVDMRVRSARGCRGSARPRSRPASHRHKWPQPLSGWSSVTAMRGAGARSPPRPVGDPGRSAGRRGRAGMRASVDGALTMAGNLAWSTVQRLPWPQNWLYILPISGGTPWTCPRRTLRSCRARTASSRGCEAVLPEGAVIHDEAETRAYECDALTAYRCPPLCAVLPDDDRGGRGRPAGLP